MSEERYDLWFATLSEMFAQIELASPVEDQQKSNEKDFPDDDNRLSTIVISRN